MFFLESFLLIFVSVNSYMRLRSDKCVIKDNLHKRVEISYAKGLHQHAMNFGNIFAFKCVFRQMINR